ncbi:hypothetical protein P12x_000718 [Tundrisphaera lichenicola]|uniref:hypothetical protein n=1 Tax=Tundrisphaera lichenicola TaxID=2029860 RepID=UPI003EBC4FC0
MSATPIFKLVDDLPENNLTVKSLHALDFVAPGQWRNLVGFDKSIQVITGETDQALIQKIGERAVRLYNDRSQGYQRAIWLYHTVEGLSNAMGAAALANKVGEKFKILSLFSKITPKSDKAQSIDFGVKLVVELVAFCQINGLPGDSIGDFVKSLTHYKNEALIRMAALIAFDGLIPLGPDYLEKILKIVGGSGASDLESNETFNRVKSLVPGGGTKEQLGLIQKSMGSVGDWMKNFTAQHDLTQGKVLGGLQSFLEVSDDRLDYVAAFLDLTTNYYEHTGTQTVARSLIERAVNEI